MDGCDLDTERRVMQMQAVARGNQTRKEMADSKNLSDETKQAATAFFLTQALPRRVLTRLLKI